MFRFKSTKAYLARTKRANISKICSRKLYQESMGHFRYCLPRLGKVETKNLHTYRRSFRNLTMKDFEYVDQFMTPIMNKVNQSKTHGEDIIDYKIVDQV